MNVDSQHSLAVGVALLYLIIDPFPVKCLGTNQNDGDRCAAKLSVDPALNCIFALALERFPIRVIDEAGAFVFLPDHSAITDLADAENVAFVMKAEENSSSHTWCGSRVAVSYPSVELKESCRH